MDQTEEIKRKIDVVGLVSSYLSLKKAGRNYKACCPFHKEKTPSFMVSPEKQIWYCFGCNQGGDIFTFIEKIEGVEFVEALNVLADRAGIILDKKNFARKSEKDKYYQILELASRFFSFILNEHPGGKSAKKYILEKRKLNEKTVHDFSIGYAPNNPTILKDYLLKKGFSQNELEKIGLITKTHQGKWVDRFRDRIIFPIKNNNGKIVGFGGRIFQEVKGLNLPKYVNSPQSDVYDKSSVLYGLDRSKESIREKDLAIVVEGYLDVISSHQAGVKNVVASSGTALTERQVEILSRYTGNIAFCFDSDEAGNLATKRAMEITRFSDINVKAIKIEGAKDPDELISKNPDFWVKLSENPMPILDFYYDILIKKYNLGKDSEDKKKIARDFIPVLKDVFNDIEKAHWVKKISQDLNVNEKYIIDALEKEAGKNNPSKSVGLEKNKIEEKDVNKIKISKENLLLASVILYPVKISPFLEKIRNDNFSEELGQKLYKIISEAYNNKEDKSELSLEYIKEKIEKEKHRDIDLLFFLALNFFEGLNEKEILDDIDILIEKAVQQNNEKRKKAIEKELLYLDKSKEKEKIKNLLKELQSLI